MSWVDDLVTNSKNAMEDAKKIGQVLMPAAPTTPLPPGRFGAVNGMSTASLMILAAVVIGGVILWKKA